MASYRRTGTPRNGSGHTYQRCIVCGRWYLIYRCNLLAGRKFCSHRCFYQSWKAFRRALANGQLENILELPVCQEVLNPDAPATRRPLDWRTS
jgi:hypothetical protein